MDELEREDVLEAKLAKIRDSPQLQSQQQTRVILSAVEDTLRDQNSTSTPTAYFAALLSLLTQQISNAGNTDLAKSVVYLLDLVTPYVPAPVLRAKFSEIQSILLPALSRDDADAPFMRAAIGTFVTFLIAQDAQAWNLSTNQAGPRQALTVLLRLSIDPRPKVRKRAQDAVASVLSHPPPNPSLDHPVAEMCAETALRTFESLAESLDQKKSQTQPSAYEPSLIHAMQLVKTIAKASGGWPSRGLDSLATTLFTIARSRSEHLTTTAFDVFETIFDRMAKDGNAEKLPHLLEAMEDIQPSQSDSLLLPPWLAVISRGYDVASQADEVETFQKLPTIFEKVSQFLASPSYNIRVSASECLTSFLVNCIPASIILEPSIIDERCFERLASVMNGLLDVKYQAAWMEVFTVLTSMLENFRWRSVPLLNKAVQTIGELRTSDAFQNKDKADEVLAKAITHMGPETVLDILPLNLGPSKTAKQGRAWLVPIIRDNVSNTKLSHFRTTFVPLSEKLFQVVVEAGEKKTMEIKIYETLVQQIWSCLPGYCDRPTDLQEGLNQQLAEMISKLLYQQPDMRNFLCHALRNLVNGYRTILAQEDSQYELVTNNGLDKSAAQESLTHLSTFASNILAVLFNIYGETLPQHRSPILESINAYLSITTPTDLSATFNRVTSAFEAAFTDQTAKAEKDKAWKRPKQKEVLPPMTHALMDIIVAMSIYLPRESYSHLFTIASTLISQQHEPALQKKAYKLIPRLASSESGHQAIIDRNIDLQDMLLANTDTTLIPARKDRLAALNEIVKTLPNDSLAFIPNILPEIILRTKETNERARETAFTLIVTMGERMKAGGTIHNSQVKNASPDAAPATASLEEYFTILSAGLAGTTPHMISASVTTISRALFEFRTELSERTSAELLDTMSLFLESPTREVVRSVLGFVKVCVIGLPVPIVQDRLPMLIPRLFGWAHEHTSNFKAKVKNILERVIRRFGIEIVERYCPEEDKKLVTNIRKTRERRKRKGGKGDVEEDGEEEDERKPKFENAFDEAIYGSDEESEGSGDDRPKQTGAKGRGKAGKGNAYIHEDEDEPLDLLDKRALANISSTRPVKAPQVKKKHSRDSKRDVDGKLVFKDGNQNGEGDDDEDMMDLDKNTDGATLEKGINAYVDAIRGKHAAQRGQRGRLKFKGSRDKDEDMDMEDDAPRSGRGEIKSPKQQQHRRRDSGGRGGRGGRVGKRGGGSFSGWKGPSK